MRERGLSVFCFAFVLLAACLIAQPADAYTYEVDFAWCVMGMTAQEAEAMAIGVVGDVTMSAREHVYFVLGAACYPFVTIQDVSVTYTQNTAPERETVLPGMFVWVKCIEGIVRITYDMSCPPPEPFVTLPPDIELPPTVPDHWIDILLAWLNTLDPSQISINLDQMPPLPPELQGIPDDAIVAVILAYFGQMYPDPPETMP